jgi:predicted DNA-binding transcriptional regulator AlpA
VKDLLDINEVCELTNFSKPTIYRRVKLGEFPQPEKIKRSAKRGPPANLWRKSDVQNWMKKNIKPVPDAPVATPTEQVKPSAAHGPLRADAVVPPEKQKPRFMVHAVLAAIIAGAMLLFFQTQ